MRDSSMTLDPGRAVPRLGYKRCNPVFTARPTGESSSSPPSTRTSPTSEMGGCATNLGALPRCGQLAACTRKGWHRKTSPASPVASVIGSVGSGSGACEPEHTVVTERAQKRRDLQVRAGRDASRCVFDIDVRQQAQQEKSSLPRSVVDVPPSVGRLEAGIDMPSRVARIDFGRKSDDERVRGSGAKASGQGRGVGGSLREDADCSQLR